MSSGGGRRGRPATRRGRIVRAGLFLGRLADAAGLGSSHAAQNRPCQERRQVPQLLLFGGGGLAIVADVIEVTSSDTVLELTNDFSAFESGSPIKTPTLVE